MNEAINDILSHFNPKPESLENAGICPHCGGNILRPVRLIEQGWNLYIKDDLAYDIYECLDCRKHFRVVPDHLWNGQPQGIKIEII
jgi:DNA-directed RNA polymerase subunit RPC12/RpoP